MHQPKLGVNIVIMTTERAFLHFLPLNVAIIVCASQFQNILSKLNKRDCNT